jgi:hypothetical protein
MGARRGLAYKPLCAVEKPARHYTLSTPRRRFASGVGAKGLTSRPPIKRARYSALTKHDIERAFAEALVDMAERTASLRNRGD